MSNYISQMKEDMAVMYHYGVKGQRWGVRRAQKRVSRDRKRIATTKRGISRTKKWSKMESGRIADAKANKKGIKKFLTLADAHYGKNLWDSYNQSFEKDLARQTKSLKKSEKRLSTAKTKAARKNRARKPVTKMSDSELRTRVDRLNLEKRYNSLSPKRTPNKFGQMVVEKFVEAAAQKTVNATFNAVGTALKKD